MPLRVFLARACNSHFAPSNGPFRFIMRRLVGDHACENAKAHVCAGGIASRIDNSRNAHPGSTFICFHSSSPKMPSFSCTELSFKCSEKENVPANDRIWQMTTVLGFGSWQLGTHRRRLPFPSQSMALLGLLKFHYMPNKNKSPI